MPFPYQTSAAPVRTRKPLRERDKDRDKDKERDKDARSTTSGSTRRHRDASRSSNRSPLPSSSRPPSLYTQANVTSDQLPPLPRSETASPSSLTSPALRASAVAPPSSTPLSSSAHLYTPAALQPYLETDDDDDDFDNAKTPQASAAVQTKPYFDREPVKVHPQAGPAQGTPTISPSAPSNQPVKTPSPKEPSTSPLALSRVDTRLSDPTPNLQHPRPHHFPASPPAFTHSLPFFGGPPLEQYISHFPPPPQYQTMAQVPGHPLDLQSLPPQNIYQPYGSPPQMQASFNPMQSPPAREHRYSNTGLSFSGDPPPVIGPLPTVPAESVLPPDPTTLLGAPKGEEDAVLQRIQSAIPDLHLLLNRYRETSGQLGERELTLRHTEAEKMKVLEQKDTYIERLSKERDEALHRNKEENSRHAEEKDKLRLEIGNMTEKHNELHEKLQMERQRREDIEKTLQTVQAEHVLMITRLSDEKTVISRELSDLRAQASRDLEAKEQKLQAKSKEYDEQLQRQAHESDTSLRRQIAELAKNHDDEKAFLEAKWVQQRRALEDTHVKLKRDLDEAKNTHKKTMEDHLSVHRQEKEAWSTERQSLTKDWESRLAELGQGTAESQSRYQKEKDELQRVLKSSEARRKKEHAESIAKMQTEIEKLQAGWDADKAKFNQATAELKATASRLDTENSKLQKLADAFEQVTDLKGREDAYYYGAFDSLQKLISALAEDFCSECPSRVPDDVMLKLPSNLPSFLVDTPAAARIRLAYVQSLVSDVIDRRIFQHFLFTYDHFDDIFNTWSECLRSKSTKREAVWRQRTLHAAFSCPGSKERINKFARSIIDEIITAIKPFTHTSQTEDIRAAVRQIVKMAAETWRYARIELSRISASPATSTSGVPQEEPLLSIFPRIEREPIPSDFRIDSQDEAGCVYSPGQTLTRKSSAVLARRVELGEIAAAPAAAPLDENSRPEYKRPRKMSSEIATRARRFEPRPDSPLIPSIESSHSSGRGATATASDEARSQAYDGPDEGTMGRRLEAQRDANEAGMSSHVGKNSTEDDAAKAAANQQAYAVSSPLQSPAHSRAHSPQPSRRATASTGSASEDDKDSENTTKPEKIPDWGGAGGNVPGAFGGQDGW